MRGRPSTSTAFVMIGGDLAVASEPGRGSAFTVRIPAGCAGDAAVPSDAEAPALAAA